MEDYDEIVKILESIKENSQLLSFIKSFLIDLIKNFY